MSEAKDPLRLDDNAKPAHFMQVLRPERVALLETPGKAEALAQMTQLLSAAPEVGDPAELSRAILAREQLLSTGIGLHAGIPHVRLASVSGIVMAVGLAPLGLTDYESIDGLPVYIIFAIAAHVSQHNQYIQLLAQVSRIMKDPESRRQLLSATSAAELYWHLLNLTKPGAQP